MKRLEKEMIDFLVKNSKDLHCPTTFSVPHKKNTHKKNTSAQFSTNLNREAFKFFLKFNFEYYLFT